MANMITEKCLRFSRERNKNSRPVSKILLSCIVPSTTSWQEDANKVNGNLKLLVYGLELEKCQPKQIIHNHYSEGIQL